LTCIICTRMALSANCLLCSKPRMVTFMDHSWPKHCVWCAGELPAFAAHARHLGPSASLPAGPWAPHCIKQVTCGHPMPGHIHSSREATVVRQQMWRCGD
jgi:hypothetical protein